MSLKVTVEKELVATDPHTGERYLDEEVLVALLNSIVKSIDNLKKVVKEFDSLKK